jgi:hypothetical protein
MIAILIGALSIAAWRTVSTISPGQVLSAVGSLAPLALGALAIASALLCSGCSRPTARSPVVRRWP